MKKLSNEVTQEKCLKCEHCSQAGWCRLYKTMVINLVYCSK